MSAKSGVEEAHEALSRAQEFEDPWLLSYADLVTNLLAMFALIVSMATISFETIEALPGAFDSDAKKRPNLATLTTDLKSMIADEGLSGQIVAEIDEQGLAIQIQDQIVFPSGVAQLSDEGRRIVGRISGLVHKLPEHYRVLVEGHTDDVPIATAQFPSNWELSAARALEVRDALARGGFPDGRLSISAYASTRPLAASNGEPIEVVRQKNRRVVIRVY